VARRYPGRVNRYRDRAQAGSSLVAHLAHLSAEGPLVLGIPRGGVEVAAPVAEALGGDLGVVHAGKVGAPGSPELAVGAVDADGIALIDEIMIRRLGASRAQVDDAVGRARAELDRRQGVFGAAPDVAGRTVIVIDDGVATGATLRSALAFVRRRGAARIVCAVPVGAAATIDLIAAEVDEVVCPLTPDRFFAVGEWYDDFGQTTDATVMALLGA
jgi:putative phosphoribosyl transferase